VTTGARLSLAGVVLAAAVFAIGTVVIPTHVSFGAGSIRCGTVLHPRSIEIPKVCERAATNQLRATAALTAVMVAFAVVPWVLGRLFHKPNVAWGVWAAMYVAFAAVGLVFLALLQYSPPSKSFQL
jgi:hypothetical protein